MPSLNPTGIIDLYRKRAKNYDITANIYYLIGFRVYHYRKVTIESLELKKGDTVVELCCGTGLNFSLIQKKIGNEGKIIGVDITDKMLEKAKERINKNNWKNVELIHCDVAEYKFPNNVDAVFSTYALSLSSEYDKVIRNCSEALKKGGKFAVLDFKVPDNPLRYFAPLLILLTKSFGVRKDIENRHLWKSVERYFQYSFLKKIYWGFAYLSVGTK